MKAQAPFVRSDGAVKLHAKAAIHLHISRVILPRDTEDELPLGFGNPLQDSAIAILAMAVNHGTEAFQDFTRGLQKLRFTGISTRDDFKDF
jgi:hypothetical protein